MHASFSSLARQLGRLGAVGALSLGFGCLGAHAQPARRPAPGRSASPTDVVYYLDGQQVDKTKLDQLAPADLVSYINVLKPAQQRRLFSTTTNSSAVLVATKAHTNSPAVLAFNQRVNAVVPLVPATPAQESGVAAARAYVQQHYPAARLESVGPVPG